MNSGPPRLAGFLHEASRAAAWFPTHASSWGRTILTARLPHGVAFTFRLRSCSAMPAEAIRRQLDLPGDIARDLSSWPEAAARQPATGGLCDRRRPAVSRPVRCRHPRPALRPLVPVSREDDKTASLRINVELLDRLMTLIGELTLIRNQSLLAFDRGRQPAAAHRAAA